MLCGGGKKKEEGPLLTLRGLPLIWFSLFGQPVGAGDHCHVATRRVEGSKGEEECSWSKPSHYSPGFPFKNLGFHLHSSDSTVCCLTRRLWQS